MAKRKRRRGNPTMNHTAETIGSALAQVANRLDAWKKQREEIAAEIQSLANSAQSMLSDLGHVATREYAKAKAGVLKNRGGRPKGYKMSAATKAKLKAAWKRRKAAAAKVVKKAGKKLKAGGAEGHG